MTEIEVPDWVLEAALLASFRVACEHTGTAFSEDEFRNARDEHDCENRNVAYDMMRAALTAALGAWVETGAYQSRLIAKRTGKLVNDWREVDKELFDAVGGQPHEGRDFRCEYRTLYTLRQEKPE